MHCNHIHCKDTTQSLLIYTEQQQRLCAHAATNIWHSFAKTKRKEQCQCEVIRWHTTKLDQFTSESVSNSHTVNIESQEHYWERKSRSIDQKRCSRITSYRQHESNHHKIRQKANLQRDEITMVKCLEKQHQEGKLVSKAHIECEPKL